MDFCNESDTRPTESVDRVSGADFPKRFSPPLPLLRCPRKTVPKPKSGEISEGDKGCGSRGSLIDDPRDGSGVASAGGDPLATFLRPLEFLPLSDSSYAENDFTPSDNIVVVVPRSRITFVVAADKFSRNVRQGGGRHRWLSPANGRTDC